MTTFLLAALLAVQLLAFQSSEDVPSCDNTHSDGAPVHRCTCKRAADDPNAKCDMPGQHSIAEPGAMCKTYCKPDHCHCANPCCMTPTARRPER